MKNLLLGIILLGISKAGAQTPAFAVADSLYASGSYAQAIQAYHKAAPSAQIALQIARSYKSLGNGALALESYAESLQQNPKQAITAYEYGKLLISKKKFETADSIFGALTEWYPTNPEYHYQRGRAVRFKKPDSIQPASYLMEEAKNAFAKAVTLDSTHLKAIGQLALLHLKRRDYPEVERLCATALRQDPENVEIIGILAQNFYYRGFFSNAADEFEKLIRLGQKTAFIHEKLGKSYYEERMYELAIEQYKILLEYDDEHYGTHHILAKLYNFLKDKEKALEYGEKALYFKDLPLDDVHMTLGATYRLHKQWPDAITHFQEAIKENPQEGNAYHALAICADNYYKDKQTVVRFYEQFITKFEGNAKYLYSIKLAQERVKILNREIFMAGDGN